MSVLINPYHFYSDVYIWLDGADPYANENASTPADGSSVTTWYDKSLNLHNFSSSGTSTAPTYDATNKKFDFTAAQIMSQGGIKNFPASEFHIFVVGKLTADGTTGVDLSLFTATTTGGAGNFYFIQED